MPNAGAGDADWSLHVGHIGPAQLTNISGLQKKINKDFQQADTTCGTTNVTWLMVIGWLALPREDHRKWSPGRSRKQ
jgi:hypothetical protein